MCNAIGLWLLPSKIWLSSTSDGAFGRISMRYGWPATDAITGMMADLLRNES